MLPKVLFDPTDLEKTSPSMCLFYANQSGIALYEICDFMRPMDGPSPTTISSS